MLTKIHTGAIVNLIQQERSDYGAKHSFAARETLYNRFNENGEFKASEIVALTGALNLTKEERDKIFLT